MKRRATAGLGAAASLLAALAACRGISPSGISMVDVARPLCDTTSPPKPRVFIGPDVNLRVLCGGTARGAVASVDEQGAGITSWRVSLVGDPAFTLQTDVFTSCAVTGPAVAQVTLTPPLTAMPGDTFDTVATVTADDGSFPPGTVKVHGQVVAPEVTVDETTIDFGDVDLGAVMQRPIVFHVTDDGAIAVPPVNSDVFDFSTMASRGTSGHVLSWFVRVVPTVPGDYAYPSAWRIGAQPNAGLPPACTWTGTIPIHVRVVDPTDGGSDGP